MKFTSLFHKKRREDTQEQTPAPQPIAIEGIPTAPLTPEPDEAELAAAAILEMMVSSSKFQVSGSKFQVSSSKFQVSGNDDETLNLKPETRTADYYRHLAKKMRDAREATRLRVARFLAFVEQELKKPHLPTYGAGSLGLLEAELYKRIDIVEREGVELKRRWQHCLALVTVRLMATPLENDGD